MSNYNFALMRLVAGFEELKELFKQDQPKHVLYEKVEALEDLVKALEYEESRKSEEK